jgi:hypothetical protein
MPNKFLSEVILDIIFEDGLFFILIKNLGSRPAFNVRIKFSNKIIGINGTKVISDLPLFSGIDFLAPGKEIKTFLDTSASYFENEQPAKFNVEISYQNSEGKKISGRINHNMEIYREIGFIKKS